MIQPEVIIAVIVGAVVGYMIRIRNLTPKEALRRVKNPLDLVKYIPKYMQKMGWQYRVIPEETENNIIGVVVDEKRVYHEESGERRRRVKVVGLDGKEWWEWIDFYDKARRELKPIIVGSGTALVTTAVNPNINDEEKHIKWHLLQPWEVEGWRRDARDVGVLKEKARKLDMQFQQLYDAWKHEKERNKMLSNELRLRDVEFENMKKAITQLEIERERLKEEVNRLKTYEIFFNKLIEVARTKGGDVSSLVASLPYDIAKEQFDKATDFLNKVIMYLPAEKKEKEIKETKEESAEVVESETG